MRYFRLSNEWRQASTSESALKLPWIVPGRIPMPVPELETMTHWNQPKWLLGISVSLFLGGSILVAASQRTEQRAKTLPQLSCEDLIRKGRAAPQFVTLTDVQLCQRGHAFRRDMDAAIEMYIPVFSTKLKKEPPAADLKLLLEVLDDRDRKRLLEQAKVGKLTVELWRDVQALDPWVGNRLATTYPGIQLANCRVISVGLHEPSEVHAQRELWDGIGMLVFATACQFGWRIWQHCTGFRKSDAATFQPG